MDSAPKTLLEAVKFFEVNEMVGCVEMAQIAIIAPPVGFAGEEGDAFARLGRLDERGEIIRQR